MGFHLSEALGVVKFTVTRWNGGAGGYRLMGTECQVEKEKLLEPYHRTIHKVSLPSAHGSTFHVALCSPQRAGRLVLRQMAVPGSPPRPGRQGTRVWSPRSHFAGATGTSLAASGLVLPCCSERGFAPGVPAPGAASAQALALEGGTCREMRTSADASSGPERTPV